MGARTGNNDLGRSRTERRAERPLGEPFRHRGPAEIGVADEQDLETVAEQIRTPYLGGSLQRFRVNVPQKVESLLMKYEWRSTHPRPYL